MRVFLFGVDGLTFRVLNPLMERGLLPNFSRLRAEGVEGILKSTTPPVTPPAWTSIATGLAPAKHGVFDFWEYEQTASGPAAHVITHRKGGRAIWNILSDWGKQVIVANVPMTYPPEPVNGMMLSGLMSPDMKANVTYPVAFKEELLEQVPGYHIDLNAAVSNGQVGEVLTDTLKMTQERNEMLNLLLKKPWDFFFIVYTGADRIQHMRWDEIMSFHPSAVRYYEMVDEALGKALDALMPEDMLMVVSDHGFQGVTRKFYLQEYLYRKGWLQMNASERRGARLYGIARAIVRAVGLQRIALPLYRRLRHKQVNHMAETDHVAILPNIDWAKSRAWIQSTSGELAGYADVYFDDTVTEEEIDEFIEVLRAFRDPENGQPLALEIHREDVFGSGKLAPDQRHVIVLSGESTSIYTQLGRTSLWETRGVGRSVSTGIHHPDGVLYLYGSGVKKGVTMTPAHVYDVVPTILSFMGVPPPDELDGKALVEPFERLDTGSQGVEQNDLVMRKLRRLAEKSS